MVITASVGSTKARAAEWTPVLSGSLSGGQYFFQNQKAGLSGNAALNAGGLAKLSSNWSLVPLYSGYYRGTKSIDDGVGAGTLFQQRMGHALSLTGIRKLEGTWRLKPSTGYKREFLKETRDETWGKGLFDYEKIAVGLEAENLYKDPFSFRVALDSYRVRFPHYESLESRSGVDPTGNPLGRELAPKKVLDTWNWQLTTSGSRPFPARDPRYVLQGSYSILYKQFVDQNLVDARGQFENSGRRDFTQTASGSIGRPIPLPENKRLDLAFGINAAYSKSNQNTFDAQFTRFIPDSYSYWLMGLGPSATLSWGEKKSPMTATASFNFQRQQYLGRLVQDSDGTYGSAKQHHDRTTFLLGYAYPIAAKLTLNARASFAWATSNHKFNRNYAYDFRAATYVIGVSYEY